MANIRFIRSPNDNRVRPLTFDDVTLNSPSLSDTAANLPLSATDNAYQVSNKKCDTPRTAASCELFKTSQTRVNDKSRLLLSPLEAVDDSSKVLGDNSFPNKNTENGRRKPMKKPDSLVDAIGSNNKCINNNNTSATEAKQDYTFPKTEKLDTNTKTLQEQKKIKSTTQEATSEKRTLIPEAQEKTKTEQCDFKGKYPQDITRTEQAKITVETKVPVTKIDKTTDEIRNTDLHNKEQNRLSNTFKTGNSTAGGGKQHQQEQQEEQKHKILENTKVMVEAVRPVTKIKNTVLGIPDSDLGQNLLSNTSKTGSSILDGVKQNQQQEQQQKHKIREDTKEIIETVGPKINNTVVDGLSTDFNKKDQNILSNASETRSSISDGAQRNQLQEQQQQRHMIREENALATPQQAQNKLASSHCSANKDKSSENSRSARADAPSFFRSINDAKYYGLDRDTQLDIDGMVINLEKSHGLPELNTQCKLRQASKTAWETGTSKDMPSNCSRNIVLTEEKKNVISDENKTNPLEQENKNIKAENKKAHISDDEKNRAELKRSITLEYTRKTVLDESKSKSFEEKRHNIIQEKDGLTACNKINPERTYNGDITKAEQNISQGKCANGRRKETSEPPSSIRKIYNTVNEVPNNRLNNDFNKEQNKLPDIINKGNKTLASAQQNHQHNNQSIHLNQEEKSLETQHQEQNKNKEQARSHRSVGQGKSSENNRSLCRSISDAEMAEVPSFFRSINDTKYYGLDKGKPIDIDNMGIDLEKTDGLPELNGGSNLKQVKQTAWELGSGNNVPISGSKNSGATVDRKSSTLINKKNTLLEDESSKNISEKKNVTIFEEELSSKSDLKRSITEGTRTNPIDESKRQSSDKTKNGQLNVNKTGVDCNKGNTRENKTVGENMMYTHPEEKLSTPKKTGVSSLEEVRSKISVDNKMSTVQPVQSEPADFLESGSNSSSCDQKTINRLKMRRCALADPARMIMSQEDRERIERDVEKKKTSMVRKVSQFLNVQLGLNKEEDLI